MNNKILVIDDDNRLRGLLCKYLEGEGFVVSTAQDAKVARQSLAHSKFDLLIVDLMMPGESGLELIEDLRQDFEAPILILTALGETEDRIRGLEKGADDYMTKPFDPRELSIRIRKLISRSKVERNRNRKVALFGDYVFEIEKHRLYSNSRQAIHLSSSEAYLLTALAENLNNPVSRERLADKLNGVSERSIDVQITRLRKRIEPDPKNPQYIHTARGKGYMLRGED